jgi:16S rRNA (cytidine1402-2'-O)-methyltransferase
MPSNLPVSEKDPKADPGTLYVAATPIGNLNDITLRAIQILRSVDLIAAEDTRQTGILLKAHHIDTRLISYHEHNEKRRTPELIERMKAGASVALVSDAGTPTISDPGYRLVCAAVANKIGVVPLPGVSAATAALSVSGLPTDAFAFIGFPEKKAGKRLKQLCELADRRETLVFYESPRRIIGLLEAVMECMGDRPAVLAREMTKQYEEFIRGSVSRILAELDERAAVKGECTLLVSGKLEEGLPDHEKIRTEIIRLLASGKAGTAEVSKQVARKFNISKKEVYALVLAVKEKQNINPATK